MAGFDANNWHNVNGGRIPFRAPTVDEALPYSPFTSVVPFSPGPYSTFTCKSLRHLISPCLDKIAKNSPDIIPYPVAEPPTPPTTLSSDQQSAARKAVGILNDEIEGPTSTAQHLEDTFRELRDLLGNPNDMTHLSVQPILTTIHYC
jgi:cohesin loading factor subunit SCC2